MERLLALLMMGGCFFEAEGNPPGGDPNGDPVDPPADPDGDPDGDGKPDVSGLKSALEKERAAVKEMRQQMKELQELAAKGEAGSKEAEELRERLAGYELRDKRSGAIDAAIAELTKDGKHSVDRARVEKLAGKLSGAESLEADVREIVETLLMPVGEDDPNPNPDPNPDPPKPKVIKGQPAKGDSVTTDLPPEEWARLYREDPEAYKEMIRARRSGKKFVM